MVAVNGTYNHGRYEIFDRKFSVNVQRKGFCHASRLAREPAEHDTHMDKKKIKINETQQTNKSKQANKQREKYECKTT